MILPAIYANYLINGDSQGLSEDEIIDADKAIEGYEVLTCSEYSFPAYYDYLLTECLEYEVKEKCIQ